MPIFSPSVNLYTNICFSGFIYYSLQAENIHNIYLFKKYDYYMLLFITIKKWNKKKKKHSYIPGGKQKLERLSIL